MSVESTIQELRAQFELEGATPLFDRLILEVQAAMPCYSWLDTDCHEEYTLVNGEKIPAKAECPSCSAGQALKVAVA